MDDLAEVVASKPAGSVKAKLAWDVLDEEDFDRLLYNIVSDAADCEKPQWLSYRISRNRVPLTKRFASS